MRISPRSIVPALLAATLAGGMAAGCGGDEGATSADSSTDGQSVEAVDFAFAPGRLTVDAGSTVTWENTGNEIHNVKGPGFFSEALEAGESYERRFDEAGTYRYVCTLHPTTMRGEISVRG